MKTRLQDSKKKKKGRSGSNARPTQSHCIASCARDEKQLSQLQTGSPVHLNPYPGHYILMLLFQAPEGTALYAFTSACHGNLVWYLHPSTQAEAYHNVSGRQEFSEKVSCKVHSKQDQESVLSNMPTSRTKLPTPCRAPRRKAEWALRTATCLFPLNSFPGSSAGKESTCSAGDPSLITGSGRSSGDGIQATHSSILGLPWRLRQKRIRLQCETWVQSLVWEDPLEKGMATHSSVLAWRIP